jgi:hypothetical protein
MVFLGEIHGYKVYWDRESGSVYVGQELAGEAYSQASAMEVAKSYIGRYPNRR